jgi:tripartite-type tricarboxylate transporter receptor subunit TctC
MKLIRTLILAVPAAALAWPSTAATFPDRPIKLVVAFPPGGGSDLVARILGKPLSEALGQPVVVENIPGAYGSIAGNNVARAPGDGHTLMLGTTGTLPIPVAMQAKLAYDTLKDFTPVTQVAVTPIVLVVNPSFPAKSYAEFATLLKSSPEPQFYGTWGIGSVGHFAGELLKSKAGLPMAHVPYKGSGPLVNDLIAGHVKIGFLEATTAAPLVHAGRLRALAVASTKRSPSFPDVPALPELGVEFNQTAWYGIVGPKNMAPEVLLRLNSELRKILDSDETRQRFIALGLISSPTSAAEFKRIIEGDIDTWSGVAKTSQIKAE